MDTLATAIGDVDSGPLYARLAVGAFDLVEAVVRVGEGDSLEGEVLDPAGVRGSRDIDQRLRHRRLHIRGAHVFTGTGIVVERPRRLVEVELPRRSQPGEHVENRMRARGGEGGARVWQLGDGPVGLLQHQSPVAIGSGDHVPNADNVLVPRGLVDYLQVVFVGGDVRHIRGAVFDPIEAAAAGPCPGGLPGGNGVGPGAAFAGDGLAGHVGSRVVHIEVPQLRLAVERGLIDAAAAHGPTGDLLCTADYRRLSRIALVVDPVFVRARILDFKSNWAGDPVVAASQIDVDVAGHVAVDRAYHVAGFGDRLEGCGHGSVVGVAA